MSLLRLKGTTVDTKKPLRASLKQLLREDNLSEKEIADLEVLHEAATEQLDRSG